MAAALMAPFAVAALVLCAAGLGKLRSPEGAQRALIVLGVPGRTIAVRMLAAAELAIGGWALVRPSAASGGAVAALYAGFCGVSLVLAHRQAQCGCFGGGAGDAAASRVQSLLSAILAAVAVAAAAVPAHGVGWILATGPSRAAVLLVGILGAAYATVIVYVELPPSVVGVGGEMSVSERIARALGTALERRVSRRSAVARAAVAGSAFAVAPLRYLLRPGTAWAVIDPHSCSSGLCTDGYTAFCCQIQHGYNQCPAGTYVAGWWKCTDYRGQGLCHKEGVRYYLDCNRIPGQVFPGGCQCANGDCRQRRVDCNHFRYGQCNTQVAGTTEVVCRLVICQHPASAGQLGCNDTLMVDDRTCTHEAPCLKGLGTQLPGGGGA